MYSKDVISFARKKGFFKGKDSEFSFSAAYAPADFSAIRFCETRVWSFFNRWVEGMDQYLDYATGYHIGQAVPMPLYFKPKQKLSLHDVMNSMRDHYEGTPFDITKDEGAGLYDAPYRPSPLTWEHDGKTYFNERPISTQQAGFTVVAQVRSGMPDAIGGVLWFGNDDPNMVAYTPVYCCTQQVPECYAEGTANDVTFSWKSAFWVCNWVANMTYPRYTQLFPSVREVRDRLENEYIVKQSDIEQAARMLFDENPAKAKEMLEQYTHRCATNMLAEWKKLGEYLIVKYNDMVVKRESDGKFTLTPDGLAAPPVRPGFGPQQRQRIATETGNRYLVPAN